MGEIGKYQSVVYSPQKETCVLCGETIPEGTQYCFMCNQLFTSTERNIYENICTDFSERHLRKNRG